MAQLAQKRGLVKKGGIPDCDAAARQILQDCQRGKFSFYTRAPNVKVLEVPEYLEPKLVTEMSAEFKLDNTDDWMETNELNAPSSGAAIGMRNDGLTEIEEFEDDSDMEEEDTEEDTENMEDDRQNEEADSEGFLFILELRNRVMCCEFSFLRLLDTRKVGDFFREKRLFQQKKIQKFEF